VIGRYQTARAFRTALEDRLNSISRTDGTDLARLRRHVAFDRLLARCFAETDPPWLLKGGYAFELRLGAFARTTRDLDLSVPIPDHLGVPSRQSPTSQNVFIQERLQNAVEHDLNDGFVYIVGMAIADLDAAPYGGARFPIEARLDRRTFATFHLDVGVGDAVVTPPEWLNGQDHLGFAGISPIRAAALSPAQQFAEKMHAYTFPRGARTNTRVKDFVDLILLLRLGMEDGETILRALRATFERRATHEIPYVLLPPLDFWNGTYTALSIQCGLSELTMNAAFELLREFWITLQAKSTE
jgi:hypothetical protein